MKAIIFPGQGAQFVGMGRDLCARSPRAAQLFQEADDLLGYSLTRTCFEGPEEDLLRTDRAQPGIYVVSVASVLAAVEDGHLNRGEVSGVAGLSLGEYTALWFAGVFSFADGLGLVQLRGSAMQEASLRQPSGMIALLAADAPTARAISDEARGPGVLVVANLNAPGQVILSGDAEALARVPEVARSHGVRKCIPLKVAGAFHSPLMMPAREALQAALSAAPLRDALLPIYLNVTAAPSTAAGDFRTLLADQLVSPVLWEASMRRMIEDGFTSFSEPPPGTTLAGMLKKINGEIAAVHPL